MEISSTRLFHAGPYAVLFWRCRFRTASMKSVPNSHPCLRGRAVDVPAACSVVLWTLGSPMGLTDWLGLDTLPAAPVELSDAAPHRFGDHHIDPASPRGRPHDTPRGDGSPCWSARFAAPRRTSSAPATASRAPTAVSAAPDFRQLDRANDNQGPAAQGGRARRSSRTLNATTRVSEGPSGQPGRQQLIWLSYAAEFSHRGRAPRISVAPRDGSTDR